MSNIYIKQNNNWCYKILNITPNASKQEIRSAYKKMILKYHPDKNKNISHEEFIKIKCAYDILSNEQIQKTQTDFYDDYGLNSNSESESDLNPTQQNIPNVFIKQLINMFKMFDINVIGTNFNKFIESTDINKILQLLVNKNIKISETNIFDLNPISISELIDIKIKINYTIKEIWDCVEKKIISNRITKDLFEEIIYPIDFKQIYEREGESVKIGGKQYDGNIIISIEITELNYGGEKYFIYDDELYLIISNNRIRDNKFTVSYLDDQVYKFNLKKLHLVSNRLGNVYMKRNFGFLKFRSNNNIIDSIDKNSIIHGNLFFIILM